MERYVLPYFERMMIKDAYIKYKESSEDPKLKSSTETQLKGVGLTIDVTVADFRARMANVDRDSRSLDIRNFETKQRLIRSGVLF